MLKLQPTSPKVLSDLSSCSDIWVVLENHFRDDKYVESYYLNSLFGAQDRFWGKMKNVHATEGLYQSSGGEVEKDQVAAFAYNNFSHVVSTSGLIQRFSRLFADDCYKNIEFVSNKKFVKIWQLGQAGGLNKFEVAIRTGRRMKVKIEAGGMFYILALHTVEFSKNKGSFSAYTEFDGFPETLRNFGLIEEVSAQIQGKYPENIYAFDTPFFMTYFRITPDGVAKIEGHQLDLDSTQSYAFDFPVDDVSIYMEL